MVAAFNVLRIHSDTVMFWAFAKAVIRLKSSPLKRTGTILPFASPLGSFGRPIFVGLAFGTAFELLHNCGLNGGSW